MHRSAKWRLHPILLGGGVRCRGRRGLAEPVGEQAVAEAAVAHGQGVDAELRQHRPNDGRAGEDDIGASRLQPDDRASLVTSACSVQVELPVDFRAWTGTGGVKSRASRGSGCEPAPRMTLVVGLLTLSARWRQETHGI